LILGDLFLDYCINPYEGCEKKQKKISLHFFLPF
jgi:hypothetical protein